MFKTKLSYYFSIATLFVALFISNSGNAAPLVTGQFENEVVFSFSEQSNLTSLQLAPLENGKVNFTEYWEEIVEKDEKSHVAPVNTSSALPGTYYLRKHEQASQKLSQQQTPKANLAGVFIPLYIFFQVFRI